MKTENLAGQKMTPAPMYSLGQEVLYYKGGVGLIKVVVRTVVPGNFVNAYDIVYGDKTIRVMESELYRTYKDAIRKTCKLLRQDAANKEDLYRTLSITYRHRQEICDEIARCLKGKDEDYEKTADKCLFILGSVLERQGIKSLAELHEQRFTLLAEDALEKTAHSILKEINIDETK